MIFFQSAIMLIVSLPAKQERMFNFWIYINQWRVNHCHIVDKSRQVTRRLLERRDDVSRNCSCWIWNCLVQNLVLTAWEITVSWQNWSNGVDKHLSDVGRMGIICQKSSRSKNFLIYLNFIQWDLTSFLSLTRRSVFHKFPPDGGIEQRSKMNSDIAESNLFSRGFSWKYPVSRS